MDVPDLPLAPAAALPLGLLAVAQAATDADVMQMLLDRGVDPYAALGGWMMIQGGAPVAAVFIVWLLLTRGKVPELKASVIHEHRFRKSAPLHVREVKGDEERAPAGQAEEEPP